MLPDGAIVKLLETIRQHSEHWIDQIPHIAALGLDKFTDEELEHQPDYIFAPPELLKVFKSLYMGERKWQRTAVPCPECGSLINVGGACIACIRRVVSEIAAPNEEAISSHNSKDAAEAQSTDNAKQGGAR